MPAAVKASINILEGDWTLGSNYMTTINPTDSVIGDKEELKFNVAWPNQYPSKASLIRTNDNLQLPFSNRLVEYLLNNAITSNEFIDSNIRRLQDNLFLYTPNTYGVWTTELRNKIYYHIFDKDLMIGNGSKFGTNVYLTDTSEGLVKVSEVRRLIDTRFDLTGFVDKDLERQLELMKEKEI